MGEHGFAHHVADGVDGGVGGLQLFVHFDESAGVDFDLGVVEAGNFGVGPAANGNQDTVENSFAVGVGNGCGCEGGADALAFEFE